MKKLNLLIISLLAVAVLQAQNLTVKGVLQSRSEGVPLSGATVKLTEQTDTLHIITAITDKKGLFQFNKLNPKTYILSVSFVGYDNFSERIELKDENIDLGVLAINNAAKELSEVKVTAVKPLATLKGDTVQYNASQFKVNPDANVEDLVKKLPGVTVDKDGTVTAQGEQVRKVTIDGRDFFGDDASAALRNLPAEIVDKIQVFDRLSEQAQFTGFDDGNTTKAINVVTKADMRNGQFGRVFAGYGTDDRYMAGGNMSFFKDNRRISIVGLANNINQQNFASQDLLGLTSSGGGRGGFRGGGGGFRGGGRGGGFGGGFGGFGFGGQRNFLVGQQSGISKTNALGINFSDQWGKKLTVSGSYFFNNSNNNNDQQTSRQYFTDTAQFYDEKSLSSSKNYNHRINMRLEYKIDSSNSLLIIPSLNFQKNNSLSSIDGKQFYSPTNPISQTLNETDRKSNGYDLSNTILFRHSFRKRGRTLSINVNTGFNKNEGATYVDAINSYYKINNIEDSLLQFTDQSNNGYSLSTNIAYTEPVGKKGQLQFNYNPSYNKSKADQETFQYDDGGGKYSIFDTSLSNKFDNAVTKQNTGISYRVGDRDKMFAIGLSYQNSLLSSDQVFPLSGSVRKTFNNILPNAMIRYKLSAKSNIRLFYRASTNDPSVTQLQNVIDNTNPLFISTGNPDLKQQYGHILSFRYSLTDALKGRTFFANIFLQANNNYITNATYIPQYRDSLLSPSVTLRVGSQLTKPVNLNGYKSLRSFLTYGIPVKFIKTNMNLNAGFTYSKAPGLVNNKRGFSDSYNYNAGVVFASNVSEYVDFTVSYSANFNVIDNTLQPELSNNYFSHSAGAQLNLLSKSGWFLQNDVSNELYNGLTDGYNQNFWLWNASIGKKFLKDRKGELKLSVFDLLKQNKSIARNVEAAYVEDVQTQVLQQYFMLTFTYQLKNFGTPKRNMNNNWQNGNFRGRGDL